MWKDWLHFSGRERNGIYALLILMLMLLISNAFMPRLIKPVGCDLSMYDALIDSVKEIQQQRQDLEALRIDHFTPDSLRMFDPNKVDSSHLRQLGFGEKSTQQLLNYINSGGQFRTKGDFAKLYAISDSEYIVLKPFILLPDSLPQAEMSTPRRTSSYNKKDHAKAKVQSYTKKEVDFIVDINASDTAILQQLYGIGPAYASRIVKYRTLLGGYALKTQLLEVYGLKQETYDLIFHHFKIDRSQLKKIQINTASVSRLRAHPYMNFYQAKAIYEYRKTKKIRSFEELLRIADLDTAGFWKLEPYLDFQIQSTESTSSESE